MNDATRSYLASLAPGGNSIAANRLRKNYVLKSHGGHMRLAMNSNSESPAGTLDVPDLVPDGIFLHLPGNARRSGPVSR